MWIQPARELARKSECTNNLKQIGLTTLNFDDTNNGLLPLTLDAGGASFWVFTMPFAESYSYFDCLTWGRHAVGNTSLELHMESNWDRLNQAEQEQIGGIDYKTCPSRRAGVQMRAKGPGRGSLADYAVVFVQSNPDSSAQGPWYEY